MVFLLKNIKTGDCQVFHVCLPDGTRGNCFFEERTIVICSPVFSGFAAEIKSQHIVHCIYLKLYTVIIYIHGPTVDNDTKRKSLHRDSHNSCKNAEIWNMLHTFPHNWLTIHFKKQRTDLQPVSSCNDLW